MNVGCAVSLPYQINGVQLGTAESDLSIRMGNRVHVRVYIILHLL